ncbi:hypothetical protein [Sorangium sp. So ce381]|uniref:hypothetical protein n=1 Tax=Sorangium sp. So ce381 TaxID=3133307 RepID=UPI003F5B8EC4
MFEQWVFRHWSYSEYFGLPLRGLKCRAVYLETNTLLAVGAGGNAIPDRTPESLLAVFEHMRELPCQPMITMNSTGTWDFPVLLLESPNGFVYRGRQEHAPKLWLIEGHLRVRYLMALAAHGVVQKEHSALVLAYDSTRSRVWGRA